MVDFFKNGTASKCGRHQGLSLWSSDLKVDFKTKTNAYSIYQIVHDVLDRVKVQPFRILNKVLHGFMVARLAIR